MEIRFSGNVNSEGLVNIIRFLEGEDNLVEAYEVVTPPGKGNDKCKRSYFRLENVSESENVVIKPYVERKYNITILNNQIRAEGIRECIQKCAAVVSQNYDLFKI